jgi:uncharacterized repeat protein (TIGR04138 family)
MQDSEFAEVVALIRKDDPRFHRKAYEFVRLGLDHTVKDLRKRDAGRADRSRHVSPRELLEGLRGFALEQFGPMAKTVLNSWGVEQCPDFGAIVFNLIEYKVFSKTETDRLEDFAAIYDFEAAFVKPFLPAIPPRGGSPTEALGSA